MVKNAPSLWGSIISKLEPIYGKGNVIIAGGCLRDYTFGYEPKDIDIFINVDTELELELSLSEVEARLQPLLGFLKEETISIFDQNTDEEGYTPEATPEGLDKGSGCVGVFEQSYKNLLFPIQLIAKPLEEFNGLSLVRTFDYSLIKMYVDKPNGLIVTPFETQRDIHNRALWLKEKGSRRTKERIKSFCKRTGFQFSNEKDYPEIFGLVNTDDFWIPVDGPVSKGFLKDKIALVEYGDNALTGRETFAIVTGQEAIELWDPLNVKDYNTRRYHLWDIKNVEVYESQATIPALLASLMKRYDIAKLSEIINDIQEYIDNTSSLSEVPF